MPPRACSSVAALAGTRSRLATSWSSKDSERETDRSRGGLRIGLSRHNPFFEVILSAAGPILAIAPSHPGGPGPYRLASSDRLAVLLRDADLSDVVIEIVPMTFESESVDDYIQMFGDLSFKSRMARLTDVDRARLRAAVADVAQPHLDSRGRLHLQTRSLCATARK